MNMNPTHIICYDTRTLIWCNKREGVEESDKPDEPMVSGEIGSIGGEGIGQGEIEINGNSEKPSLTREKRELSEKGKEMTGVRSSSWGGARGGVVAARRGVRCWIQMSFHRIQNKNKREEKMRESAIEDQRRRMLSPGNNMEITDNNHERHESREGSTIDQIMTKKSLSKQRDKKEEDDKSDSNQWKPGTEVIPEHNTSELPSGS
jgi:hypothetical protein